MGVSGNARIAIRAMLRRPLRTFLVLQGVVWAAAVIVFPSAIEKGSVRNALLNAERFKTDQITVRAQEKPGAEMLTLSDVKAIEEALAGRECRVTPFRTSSGEAFVTTQIIKTTVVGTDQTAPETRSFHSAKGRYLTARDVSDARHVCVLEALAAKELFPDKPALHEKIALRYGGRLLTAEVVGVMEKRDEERLATDDQGFRRDLGEEGDSEKFRVR